MLLPFVYLLCYYDVTYDTKNERTAILRNPELNTQLIYHLMWLGNQKFRVLATHPRVDSTKGVLHGFPLVIEEMYLGAAHDLVFIVTENSVSNMQKWASRLSEFLTMPVTLTHKSKKWTS